MFGQKITAYSQFASGTYGYVISMNTAPNIKSIMSIQAKTNSVISDVITAKSELTSLMQFMEDSTCPDVAFSLMSGVVYIFFKSDPYVYEDDTRFLIMGYRYPEELLTINSALDIRPDDIELFITLSIAIACELQGKLMPQRILDKIQYLQNVINLENQ